MDLSIFLSGGSKERKNVALKVMEVNIFSYSENIESYRSYMRVLSTIYLIWYGVGVFLGRLISLFPMAYMCLIWLNIHLFSWILVPMMSLSLQAVKTCTLLHFTVSCWLEMSSITCWTVVCYFLLIINIQTLVLFLDGYTRLHGLLFYYWEIY